MRDLSGWEAGPSPCKEGGQKRGPGEGELGAGEQRGGAAWGPGLLRAGTLPLSTGWKGRGL